MPLKKYFKAFPSFCNAWLSQLFSQILFQGKFHLECKGNQINWARPFLFCSFVTFFSLVFYVSTFCCFFFLFLCQILHYRALVGQYIWKGMFSIWLLIFWLAHVSPPPKKKAENCNVTRYVREIATNKQLKAKTNS